MPTCQRNPLKLNYAFICSLHHCIFIPWFNEKNFSILLRPFGQYLYGFLALIRSGSSILLRIFFFFLRRGSTSSLSHFLELYGAASVAPMWFPIVLSLLLIRIATEIEGQESRTGRALENAYKYCPSGNGTRQISKSENWKIKKYRELILSKRDWSSVNSFFAKWLFF